MPFRRAHYLPAVFLPLALSACTHLGLGQPKPVLLFAGQNDSIDTQQFYPQEQQLWQTDNSSAGTNLYPHVSASSRTASSNPEVLGNVGKFSLFSAFTPELGRELWRTDGTAGGTGLLKDFAPGKVSGLAASMDKSNIATLPNHLLFWSHQDGDSVLTASDGTPAGTQALARLPSASHKTLNYSPQPSLHTLNGQVLFWFDRNGETANLELWRSDGTASGTTRLLVVPRKKATVDYSSTPDRPVRSADALYFLVPRQAHYLTDYTLWRSDGKQAEQLAEFPASMSLLLATPEHLFWGKTPNERHPELWQFDLKTRQQKRLFQFSASKDIPLTFSSNQPLVFDGGLYLWLDKSYGEAHELWRSDVSTGNTQRLLTVENANPEYKTPPRLFAFAGRLYFFTQDGSIPDQLWITNGKPSGTRKLLNGRGGGYAGDTGTWGEAISLGERLLFTTFAPNDRQFSRLWALSAANPEKPELLGKFADPKPLPRNAAEQNGVIHFISGAQQWQTDGTKAGTQRVGKPLPPKPEATVGIYLQFWRLPITAPRWLVNHFDPEAGAEPGLLTPADPQAHLLRDLNQAAAGQPIGTVYAAGDTRYFIQDSKLWMTQGKPGSTQTVRGIPAEQVPASWPHSAAMQGDTLYFLTETETNTTANPYPLRTSYLWQVQGGQARQLARLADGFVRLFPSSAGVYVQSSLPNYGWQLQQWQAASQMMHAVIEEPAPKNASSPPPALQEVLEVPDGLIYLVQGNYNATPSDPFPNDWLLWRGGKQQTQTLAASFKTPSTGLNSALFKTAQGVFAIQENGDARQLFRINLAQQRLEPVKGMPTLSTQARIKSGANGLYILTGAQADSLWHLSDHTPQPTLLKRFTPGQRVELAQTQQQHLYFNIITETPTRDKVLELWISDGSAAGTRLLKKGVAMLVVRD